MPSKPIVPGDDFDLVPDYRNDQLIIKLYAPGETPGRDRPVALVRLNYFSDLEEPEQIYIESRAGRVLTSTRSRRAILDKLLTCILAPHQDLYLLLDVLSHAHVGPAYVVIVHETWSEATSVLGMEFAILPEECIKEAGIAVALGYRALCIRHVDVK